MSHRLLFFWQTEIASCLTGVLLDETAFGQMDLPSKVSVWKSDRNGDFLDHDKAICLQR